MTDTIEGVQVDGVGMVNIWKKKRGKTVEKTMTMEKDGTLWKQLWNFKGLNIYIQIFMEYHGDIMGYDGI